MRLPQPRLQCPKNRRETQHGECRGADQGRGGSCCGMCPPGRPLRAVSSGAAWSGCGGRGRRGAPDPAYSEARGRHVSRQRHCSLPGSRAPARRSRPLHLLPQAPLQPVRNDAASGPSLPPSAPGRGSERGAGRRTESARGWGEGGGTRRKPPEAPPASQHSWRTGPRRRRGGRARRVTPARLAGRRSSSRVLPGWTSRPPRVAWAPDPLAAVRAQARETGAFLKEKQTVVDSLLLAPWAHSILPRACAPKRFPTRPASSPTTCLLFSLSSFPYPGLVYLRLSSLNLITPSGQSLLKIACLPPPKLSVPSLSQDHYSGKDLYNSRTH